MVWLFETFAVFGVEFHCDRIIIRCVASLPVNSEGGISMRATWRFQGYVGEGVGVGVSVGLGDGELHEITRLL